MASAVRGPEWLSTSWSLLRYSLSDAAPELTTTPNEYESRSLLAVSMNAASSAEPAATWATATSAALAAKVSTPPASSFTNAGWVWRRRYASMAAAVRSPS
eukprot:Amastigsp_a679190_141.p3 type:complete len:101 gc:universal Amastigsp_a679190_141:431-129(-)